MESLFKSKKRNCFLLLSSLLLCLSCSEEIIEGGATASKSNESANDMIATEELAREKYYPDADVSESSMEAPQTRATADDTYRLSWMGKLDDKVLLTNLTIPGTHDSAADTGGGAGEFALCQAFSIQKQLELGIRAFDIRCRHISDVFAMHHDVVYLNKMFGKDVRNVFIKFLREHPSETIIMMVKEEYTAANNSRSFEATLADYIKGCEEFFLLDERDGLTLKDARRKIVLLRRFNSSIRPMGHKINIGDNTYSESNTTIRASIQDCYSVKAAQTNYKWEQVTKQIQRACGLAGNSFNPQTLYINFLSCTAFPDTPLILASGGGYRWGINKCLNTDLNLPSYAKGRFGIMYLDFLGTFEPEIILKLINSNMGKGLETYNVGHHASSEEKVALAGRDGLAIHAFDGNANTFWMTQYSGFQLKFPHSLTMDLNNVRTVNGVKFTNRKDAMAGRPEKYNVEYSTDGRAWTATRVSAADQIINAAIDGEEISKAAAIRSAEIQKNIYMAEGKLNSRVVQPQSVRIQGPVSARFIRVNFVSARENTYYVHLAEMDVF